MQGDLAEAGEYDLAKALATQNANYTAASTAISAAQQDRATTMTIGSQKAAVGGAGLEESGSALDLLRDSASQGALAKSVLVTQGQMTEAGYTEQANSYGAMSAAAKRRRRAKCRSRARSRTSRRSNINWRAKRRRPASNHRLETSLPAH